MVEIFSCEKDGFSRVRFFYPGNAGHSVALAGIFNDWDSERDKMNYSAADNGYVCELLLASGVYEYKLVVDGQWLLDEGNKDFVSNDFGTLNNIITVG